MNSFKQNFVPFLFFGSVVSLLLFPIWSHLDQKQEILVTNYKLSEQENKIKQLELGSGGPLGGITRTKIGIQTAWITSLVPSASFNVNLGSVALPVKDIFTTNASVSGTFEMGATSLIKGAGLASCTGNGEVLRWSSTTFLFSCGTLADADIPNNLTLGTVSGAIDAGGATSFEVPNSAGGSAVDAAGEVTVNTSSASFNFYDGTAERVLRDRKCFTYAFESPTTTEHWGRKYFDDPFTITDITVIASGNNAVGWTILHGPAGAITTNTFSANKSASSSTSPTYTSFADATLTNGEYTLLNITSPSATIENLDVTICGRNDAP